MWQGTKKGRKEVSYILTYFMLGMGYATLLFLTNHRSFKRSLRDDLFSVVTAVFLLWPVSLGFDLYFMYYDPNGKKRRAWERERNEQAQAKEELPGGVPKEGYEGLSETETSTDQED